MPLSVCLHGADCCTDSSDVDGDIQSFFYPTRMQLVYVYNKKHQKDTRQK